MIVWRTKIHHVIASPEGAWQSPTATQSVGKTNEAGQKIREIATPVCALARNDVCFFGAVVHR